VIKQCDYCYKKFKIASAFEKHECKEMKRDKYSKTLAGTRAYNYFVSWVKAKHSSSYDLDYFLDSNYFNSFVRFEEYVSSRNVASISTFLQFLCFKQLTPNTWCSDLVYTAYVEFLDVQKPLDSAILSLQTLNRLGTTFNCNITEVLYKLYPNEYIHLLQTRHLSPWLLLNTKGFQAFLMSGNLNKEQVKIINNLIPLGEWTEKMKNNPEQLTKIKGYIEKLKL